MLRAFLDYHRAIPAMKCDGPTGEELRRKSVPPSALSLLGLVRHMAEVERAWFRRVFQDNDAPMVWSDTIDFQAAYDASASTRDAAFAAWETEVENARSEAGGAAVRGLRRILAPTAAVRRNEHTGRTTGRAVTADDH